jgi:hypothetical protein
MVINLIILLLTPDLRLYTIFMCWPKGATVTWVAFLCYSFCCAESHRVETLNAESTPDLLSMRSVLIVFLQAHELNKIELIDRKCYYTKRMHG